MKLLANQLRRPYLSVSMNGGYSSFGVWLKRSSSWGALRARAHLHQSPSCRCLGERQEHGLLVSAKDESPRVTDFQLFCEFSAIWNNNGCQRLQHYTITATARTFDQSPCSWRERKQSFQSLKRKNESLCVNRDWIRRQATSWNILVGCDKFKAD